MVSVAAKRQEERRRRKRRGFISSLLMFFVFFFRNAHDNRINKMPLKNTFRWQVKKIKEPAEDEVGVALFDLYLVPNVPVVGITIFQTVNALFQS
jgi:hypothetical protein